MIFCCSSRFVKRRELDLNDLLQIVLAQPIENDDLIDAIEKLRPEMRAQRVHHQSPTCFFRFFLGDVLRTDVRGHDDDGVLEIDRSPLPVRDPAVIEHLQQHVEHVRCAFSISSKSTTEYGLRRTASRKLAAFLVTDVSRRRADQSRDGVFLHVFAHVDPDHGVLVVEQKFRERAGQLRFADASWSEKNERAERAIRILQTGAGAAHGVRNGFDRFVLADDALMQMLFQFDQLFAFAFLQSRDRNVRPARNHFGDVFLGHFFAKERFLRLCAFCRRVGQFPFQLRNPAVLNLARFSQFAATLRALEFGAKSVRALPSISAALRGPLSLSAIRL